MESLSIFKQKDADGNIGYFLQGADHYELIGRSGGYASHREEHIPTTIRGFIRGWEKEEEELIFDMADIRHEILENGATLLQQIAELKIVRQKKQIQCEVIATGTLTAKDRKFFGLLSQESRKVFLLSV